MSIISQTFITEMKEFKKLIQNMNQSADKMESCFWELGDLQRRVDVSIEVMRLREKAKKFNELFYDLAAGEMLSKIHYILSRSPNTHTKHIIDQICEEWIDAKLITAMYEHTIIVNRIYGRSDKESANSNSSIN
jgi:hypothetical protein